MAFLLSIPTLAWLLLSVSFFAYGEFLSKKFSLSPSWEYIALMLVAYSLGALAWLPAIMQRGQLSTVGVVWSLLSLLVTVLIGLLVFNEQLSIINILGIMLAFVSVALLLAK